jgi:prolyl-tRNA synthetase
LRASHLFFPTLREVPAEAELPSHRLLLRAGFIRKLAAGIYTYLPLGWRVLRKVEMIVRQEMDATGAQELLLPALHPEELWAQSGRASREDLLRLRDRGERDFILGATHEEAITDLVRQDVGSYRDLPVILYQIQTKFRDEPRPRGGLIRAREFVMKDAYSFDRDHQGMNLAYDLMEAAYERIFRRCGVEFIKVEAEAVTMGGTEAKEFMMLCDRGEDLVFTCPSCGYSASGDMAEYAPPEDTAEGGGAPLPHVEPRHSCLGPHGQECPCSRPVEKVATPGMKTVQEVTRFLGVESSRLIKTLIYRADGKPVAALVRGDRELNEGKLALALGATKLEMADAALVQEVTHAAVGFAGPLGLKDIPLIADHELCVGANYVTGANEDDAHLVNVNPGRDFAVAKWASLRRVTGGDPCPHCRTPLVEHRAIELGHIFKLGTFYSDALGAFYRGEDGAQRPIVMGCYGIGVSRIIAAAVEQGHDDAGIIWPLAIAPYHCAIIIVNAKEQAQQSFGEEIYQRLSGTGVEALLDDRQESPGVKFKDMDLVGIPLQVVVGKRAGEGLVEARWRGRKGSEFMGPQQVAAWAREQLEAALSAQ